MKSQLDFLGIGDVVIDTFLELIDAWIEDDNPEKHKELCMHFGGKTPYESEVVVPGVGNAMNAAHAAMKLGLNAGVVTNIGDDENGKMILEAFKENGIDASNVKKHKGKRSNHNYILRYKEERTILVHHNEYDYKLPKTLKAPKWMYLSSLANNSLQHHYEIAEYLKAHPETKLAFQPGTFQMKLGREKLSELYKLSYVFFCNKEEAAKILKKSSATNIKSLLKGLRATGPEIVVITDGPRGAFVYDGNVFLKGKMYPDPAPPVDRTGAGDSFSATFTTALAMGKSLEEALMWGPINSMNVVQYIGAQEGHLTKTQLLRLLKNAPKDYKPIRI